jgi:hypothetical protein
MYRIWLQGLAEHHPVMFTSSESPAQNELARARFIGGEDLRSAVADVHRPRLARELRGIHCGDL